MYILNTNCKVWYAVTMNPEEIYGQRCSMFNKTMQTRPFLAFV